MRSMMTFLVRFAVTEVPVPLMVAAAAPLLASELTQFAAVLEVSVQDAARRTAAVTSIRPKPTSRENCMPPKFSRLPLVAT